ncbi:type II and III secretion system protein, partial [Campylobacter sp. IFREMER_LSEM_CL908]
NIFEYAELASTYNNVDILVSSNINPDKYIFYTNKNFPNITLDVFESALKLQNLKLAFTGSFYYVYENNFKDNNLSYLKNKNNNKNLRYIRLNKNSYDDISSLLNIYDINSTYIYRSNSISFLSDDFIYSKLKSAINDIDSFDLKQLKFKITILETNLDNLKDMGSTLKARLKNNSINNFNFYVNLITIPYSTENNIIEVDKKSFYSTLSFLENKGITKIVSNPFLVARSNSEVFFSSVQNIPFLKSTTQVSNTEVAQNSSYDYKDVGLQVRLKPLIIGDLVDFDLHLIVEDLISNNNLTPITSKKELKSSYTLKRGDLLVLSGINKQTNINYESGIPLLKDIWLLGYLFKIERNQVSNTVLTLSIEIL